MEYISDGTLRDHIKSLKNIRENEPKEYPSENKFDNHDEHVAEIM